MPRHIIRDRARRLPRAAALVSMPVLAGAGLAVLAGMASGSSFTVNVRKNVHVTNGPTKSFAVKPVDTHESVGVGPAGYAVYTFQGESTHHLKCTSTGSNGCLGFWPPLQVKSAKGVRLANGIKGKIGTFDRKGVGLQVTLNNQPLYYFKPDLQSHNKGQATGDEIKTFGSTWHIVTADPAPGGAMTTQGSTQQTMSTQTSTTTTTTTTTCAYPGYC